jgi:YHS domain-containing protein
MKPLFAVFSFIILLSNFSFSQNEVVKRTEYFNLQKGIAIKGYDPVEFFNSSKATQANGTIFYEYNGVKYFFTSSKNLLQFKATPSKFEPKYGGWCAFHMSKDASRVAANPQCFTVQDGKLYFFASDSDKKEWIKNNNVKKTEGDLNWASITE